VRADALARRTTECRRSGNTWRTMHTRNAMHTGGARVCRTSTITIASASYSSTLTLSSTTPCARGSVGSSSSVATTSAPSATVPLAASSKCSCGASANRDRARCTRVSAYPTFGPGSPSSSPASSRSCGVVVESRLDGSGRLLRERDLDRTWKHVVVWGFGGVGGWAATAVVPAREAGPYRYNVRHRRCAPVGQADRSGGASSPSQEPMMKMMKSVAITACVSD